MLVVLLFGTSFIWAQSNLSGTIKTTSGDPLIGVNIIEKGTSNGTVTDIDGNFNLSVGADATLELTYTGYQDKDIAVGNQTVLELTMEEGAQLDEVIVTALGIERKKKALAYSVTELGGEELSTAKEVNVANSLVGKVAGVNVSKTATGPGGSTRIVIRGNNTLQGTNQPLIVVDGVPINNDNLGSAGMWGGQDWGDGISSLNSDDIEKVTVLKGNTASALYGWRAGNGVILVTTKKGKKQDGIGISYSTNFQTESIIDLYDFQSEYGHGLNGMAPTTEAQAFEGGLFAWGAKLDGSSVIQFDGVSRPYANAGNNIDRFYRSGNTWTNNLSFNGGTEDINYRISLTNLENTGITPNSGLNRKTFNASTNGRFGKFTASISGSYVSESVENRPRLSDSPGNANYTVWSLPASINVETLKGTTDKFGANEDGFELQFNDNVFVTNPYWAAYQFEANNKKNRLFGNFALGYELIDGLTIQGKVGVDRFTERRRTVEPYGTAFTNLGAVSESNREVSEVNLEATIRYTKDLNKNIGIDLLVGGNKQKNFNEGLGIRGANLNVPFLHTPANGANQTFNYDISEFRVNSVFAQAEIALWNNLYITATARQDWFSILTNPDGSGENGIFYPSIGVSYDLAGAGLDLPDWIDLGKLRVSWAQVGGAGALQPYLLNQTYGIFSQGHLGQPLGGINGNRIPPSGLKPSTNTEFEIGLDFRLLKGRANVDFAVYNKSTTEDILFAAVSPTSGAGSKIVNVGEITNKGVEVLFSVNPIRKKNFRWDIGINYAFNDNNVERLLTPEADEESIRFEESRTRNAYIEIIEGQPFSQVIGFAYARDASGNIQLDDNGLPIAGDRMAFGTGVAPTQIGIQNKFQIGGISVAFLIDMKTGAKIYNATNAYGYFRGLHKETLVGRESGLGQVAAENVEDYYQRIAFGISEEFIDDADFIKLREVVIGYKIPASLMGKLPFKNATISFAGRNLAILSKKTDNIDPESTYTNGNGQGLEMFGVPTTRSYGLNLRVDF